MYENVEHCIFVSEGVMIERQVDEHTVDTNEQVDDSLRFPCVLSSLDVGMRALSWVRVRELIGPLVE